MGVYSIYQGNPSIFPKGHLCSPLALRDRWLWLPDVVVQNLREVEIPLRSLHTRRHKQPRYQRLASLLYHDQSPPPPVQWWVKGNNPM